MRARAIKERAGELRVAEEAALSRWIRAAAAYDAALERRRRAVQRATATVYRRMAPMKPGMYVNVEAMLAGERPRYSAPRRAALAALHVRRTRNAVDDARVRLAAVTATEDAKVTDARRTRAEATAELLRAVRNPAMVTGLTMRQLGVMRSGR